jgi:hypothetical protein
MNFLKGQFKFNQIDTIKIIIHKSYKFLKAP